MSSPTSAQADIMPPADRSKGRNVHIYDLKDVTTVLGGLRLTNGVTKTNFYSMVDILFVFSTSFDLQDEGNTKIERNDDQLQPGSYYITTTVSHTTGSRLEAFTDTIRQRDRRCLISGEKAVDAHLDEWTGFEATHIFPTAYEGYWKEKNYDYWITIQPKSGGTINSVQNGILLNSAIHQLFDSYILSINPDDNFKIVFFSNDGKGLAGKHLDQAFRDDPQRPVDQLLRWHFRQAVLANMRGVGEPVFEHDFPPGSDFVGDILSGPKPAERMQFELFTRLAAQVDICTEPGPANRN